MGWKVAPGGKAAAAGEKLRLPASSAAARSRMKLWVVRATTTVLLWTCVVQLTAVGDTWGPRVLKGWPSCLTAPEEEAAAAALPGAAATRSQPIVEKAMPPPMNKAVLPPKYNCVVVRHGWHGQVHRPRVLQVAGAFGMTRRQRGNDMARPRRWRRAARGARGCTARVLQQVHERRACHRRR